MATRHPVDFAYTPQELQALFRYTREQDVKHGARMAFGQAPHRQRRWMHGRSFKCLWTVRGHARAESLSDIG